MNTNPIDQQLTILRQQLSGRASLLKAYNQTTNQLSKLPKNKENYDAILALNEEQEALSNQLKENKKLQETYLQKIEEKGALIKAENPQAAQKILEFEKPIAEKEIILLGLSESVTAATELLNELSKLTRVGGKTKSWGFSILLGKLLGKSKKHAGLQEAKEVTMNIRKLTKRYKKALGNIKKSELSGLSINRFIEIIDQFSNNVLTKKIMDKKVGSLMRISKNFENNLLKQLEQIEERESKLENQLKEIKQDRIEWIEKS